MPAMKPILPRPTRQSITDYGGDSEPDQQSAKSKEQEYITGIRLAVVITAVTTVCFLILLDTSIIVTAIPSITTRFHSLEDLGWYGSSYQIASACLQPLAGRIYTHFSLKWTFLAFLFTFEVGSLLCAIAVSSKMLIIARAVAGLGSSGLINGSLTIVSSSVPLHKSPPLVGVVMGFAQLGVAFGPLLGGALTQYTTWRWCFYINLPMGAAVAILLTFTDIPEQVVKPPITDLGQLVWRKLDIVGFALFAPAAIQLLLALELGQNGLPWGGSKVIGLLCGSACTFVLFVLWEYRQGAAAMIPLSMIRMRVVWASCLLMWLISAMTLSASYYLPVYFQATRDVSPFMSGVYMLPSILSQLLFSVLSGILIGKLGYYLPWAVFCGIATSVGHGLISTWTSATPAGKWVGYQVLVGAGRGSGYQTPMIAVQNTLPPAQISIALSIITFSQTLSGAIFLTFANLIFSNGLRSLIPKYASGIDPQVIITSGATGVRNVVTEPELGGVLKAYSQSVGHVFYMAAALGVCCVATAFGMGWKSIKKKAALNTV
ncbi:MDR family MFS transporter [Aspergillus alliaceus]|uniref:MDR family MFS transporter n=1 Tax=Petromyces alliaceus TaxID=209559 RepID=UPI0012A49206|nr:major facilitator superfamily domain-containing protein [Aspergillus alliaceus]KAB8230296.1 major facilitator superfamily domain-containing protein [Aspergillus alliaceus]